MTLLRGTAFVTGAGSGESSIRVPPQWQLLLIPLKGIGQNTAYTLAKYGVERLAISDINPDNLENTAKELGRLYPDVEVKSLVVDTSSEQSIINGVRETVKSFGSIDIAVNNAGIGGPVKPSDKVAIEEWKSLMDVNLHGVWLCQREEIRQMLKQESVASPLFL